MQAAPPREIYLVRHGETAWSLTGRHTGELAGFAGSIILDPDLYEWNYGRYEGRTLEDIRRAQPGRRRRSVEDWPWIRPVSAYSDTTMADRTGSSGFGTMPARMLRQ